MIVVDLRSYTISPLPSIPTLLFDFGPPLIQVLNICHTLISSPSLTFLPPSFCHHHYRLIFFILPSFFSYLFKFLFPFFYIYVNDRMYSP